MPARKKKPSPYTSESLAVSRRGPLHEERAIIYDLMSHYRHLQSTLAYYDRSTGKPIADEAEKLRQETWRRIEALSGSSRAKARELCTRIIDGETVPIDELRRVTTPETTRAFLGKQQHATKKTARQLDGEIADALTQRSKKPSSMVLAVFESMVDNAETEGGENLSLGQRGLGYTGDPKEFRFSKIFASRIPGAKYERLVEIIEEHSQRPHDRLGRVFTPKEAAWMLAEARKIYGDERRHIDNVLRERNL